MRARLAVTSFRILKVTSAQLSGGQWIAAMVRAQNNGQSAYAGLYFWNRGSPELMLFKRIAGTWTQLGVGGCGGADCRHALAGDGDRHDDHVPRERGAEDHGHRHQPDRWAPGMIAYGTSELDNGRR